MDVPEGKEWKDGKGFKGLSWRQFVSNSTAHGLKTIFERDGGLVRRTLWAAMFVTSVGVMGYLMYTSYVHILQHPFTTVSSISLTSTTVFPTLTICSLSPKFSSGSDSQEQSSEEQTANEYSTSSTSQTTDTVPGENATEDGEPFFMACEYKEKSMPCGQLFKDDKQANRMCYTLKDGVLTPATRRTSLILTIFVDVDEYPSFLESTGVMFHVHEAGYIPDMTIPRHIAATGFTTTVGIRLYEYQYLPAPYKAFADSACTDTETEVFRSLMDLDPELYPGSRGTRYSLDACVNSRSRELSKKACNCSQDESGEFQCGSDQISCFVSTLSDTQDLAMTTDLLGCVRACHSYRYLLTLSLGSFPSRNGLEALAKKGIAGNFSHIRDNYLQLRFFLEDLLLHKTEHVPVYEWSTIIGLFGGNMGFFLGASILTVAESLDFVVCLLLLFCQKLCHRISLRRRKAPVASHADLDHGRKQAW